MTDAPRKPEAAFTEYARNIGVDRTSKVSAALVANHLAYVEEMVYGIRTVLALAEHSLIDAGTEGGPPILGDHHMGSLMRMAIRAAESVGDRIGEFEEHLTAKPPDED